MEPLLGSIIGFYLVSTDIPVIETILALVREPEDTFLGNIVRQYPILFSELLEYYANPIIVEAKGLSSLGRLTFSKLDQLVIKWTGEAPSPDELTTMVKKYNLKINPSKKKFF